MDSFFLCFSSSVVVVDFIGTVKSKAFELFVSSATIFIVVISLCLYIGLLQSVQFSFPFFSFFFALFLILILIFKPIIFSTFIPLFAFPTALFPLKLIFNVYKSFLSTYT